MSEPRGLSQSELLDLFDRTEGHPLIRAAIRQMLQPSALPAPDERQAGLRSAAEALMLRIESWDADERPEPETTALRAALAVAQVPAQEERLDELRELSEKATPGPWRAEDNLFLNENWSVGTGGIDGLVAEVWTHSGRDEADAAFIVAAVNYVRAAQDDALLTRVATTRALGVESKDEGAG